MNTDWALGKVLIPHIKAVVQAIPTAGLGQQITLHPLPMAEESTWIFLLFLPANCKQHYMALLQPGLLKLFFSLFLDVT